MITHGHVAALNIGKAEIHAVFNGVESNDVHVTVIDSVITALQITPAISNIAINSAVDYVAQATFSDGNITTTQDVSHLVAWKSLHHDIATLTHGSAIGVKQGDAEILAVLNKQHIIAQLSVSNKQLKSLQVTPANQTIAVGSATEYKATAIYDDNSSEDVSELVNWNSSDSNLVTLYSGVLEAVAAGNVTIHANYKGINSNQAQLSVDDIYLTSIQVTPAAIDIQIGTNEKYRAIGFYSDNSSQDITHQVNWGSSNTYIATIVINQISNIQEFENHQETQAYQGEQTSSNTQHEDQVHAFASGINSGNAFITADFADISSNPAQLRVTEASLQSLQITPAQSEISIGSEIEFDVIGYFSDGSSKAVTESVHWINSRPDIITIIDGTAETISAGQVTLQASIQEIISNTATINVSAATITSIQVTPANASIASGTDINYRAIATYSDNSQQDVTEIADWQSSHTAIATASVGDVHSMMKGSAKITAHIDNMTSNAANLTVTDAKLTQLQLSPTVSTVAKGNHQHYQVTGYFSDGSSKLMTQDVHWQNSAPHIATLIEGEADAFNQGRTQITVNMDGIVSNVATLNVSSAVIRALQISPANSNIALGTDQHYQAIATYSDQTTLDVTEQANWQSQQLNIATIKQGEAHSIASGNTMIMANIDGIVSNHANLTVTNAQLAAIQVTPANITLANGSHIHYQANGIYSDGSSRDITHLVTWKSQQPNIAMFAEDELETLSQGNTVITANMDGMTSNAAQLSVTAAQITELQITTNDEQIAKGTYTQFQALATYTDKTVQDVTDSATWTSSNLNIATINSGKAHAEQQGSVIISARYDGISSNQRELEVKQANIRSIQVSPAMQDIALGLAQQFIATAVYTDDSIHDITSLAAWNSDNTNVATIVKGHVSSNNIGNVKLSAHYQGVMSNQAQLNITEKVISKLQLTPTEINLAKGTTEDIHVKATYTDGSTRNVTDSINWYANNPNIGSLTDTTITGVNQGSSILYAYVPTTSGLLKSNIINVNVSAAELTHLYISPEGTQTAPSQLKVHQSNQFLAYGVYSDSSLQDLTQQVNWNSSDTNKATVNKGNVHTEQAGMVTISATVNDKISAQTLVNVEQDQLVRIDVSAENSNIPLGMQMQFTAKLIYESGLTEEITNTNELSWSSSSANLTIDQAGVATANQITTGIIVSAIKNDIKGQATINVTDATVKEFYLQFIKPEITHDITPQSKRQIQAVAVMTDDTKNWVSWNDATNWYEDSNGRVTTVVNGVVTGVAPGTSKITAEYRGVTTAPFTINVLQPGSYSCQEHEITVWDGRRLTFTCPITTEEFLEQGYKDRYNNRVGDGRTAPTGMNVPMVNWDTANKYCTDNGWRLPTIAELEYLQSRANTKNPKGFGVYTRFGWPINAHFWSSDAEPGTKHWLLNMYSRNPILRYDKTQYHYFSCFKPK
ncbi:Ig-like domain-containing protein [Shewanella marina]|uniref:Ig-like domain-containing protein n=1 Tax=Shewanella marina TaxID=487319 RepID=UPI0004706BA7|nr:Ig-like domain-containing protein [Shewanella marina]